MTKTFQEVITDYLIEKYGDNVGKLVFNSLIIQYLVYKTKSANRGSKSRGSFANLYAIYVIVEDYINKGYNNSGDYSEYEGAVFTDLFIRQRQLPFGEKLQNHALNNRMNEEFLKCFPQTQNVPPIMRNRETQRYWFNENYLKVQTETGEINIAEDVISIIDMYVETKQDSFKRFIDQCSKLQNINTEDNQKVITDFIIGLLAPNVDARLFEIVSYSILKYYYVDKTIIWGYDYDNLTEENLKLYKTGRTNANDGGIDFVMKPLGRFFQVTETLDFKKYFLDIEKIEKYPISFVIKTNDSIDAIKKKLKNDATKTYVVKSVVDKYISCIEELITIPILTVYFNELINKGQVGNVLNEIILQSKVEFNLSDDEEGNE